MENPIKKAEKKIIWYTVMAIIILGVVFYLGGKFATSSAPVTQAGQFNRNNGTQTFIRNGGGLSGSVIKKDNQSITIKTRDGSTKIVFISDSTRFLRTVVGSQTDVDVGSNITIAGTANTDGSFNATNIEIR